MTIKPFSPITSLTSYNISDNIRTEIMFSDNESTLYAMILRQEYDDLTKYFVLEKLKLTGYNNGTDYDYRIDLADYIKIVKQTDLNSLRVTSPTTINYELYNVPRNDCNMYLIISTIDPYTANSSIINTLSNGQKYILTSSIGLLTGDKIKKNIIFTDHNDYWISSMSSRAFMQDYVYTDAPFLIITPLNSGYTLDYVMFYDTNNNIVSNYGVNNQVITGSESIYKVILFVVPKNVSYVIISESLNGTSFGFRQRILKGCAKGSYLYYSNNFILDNMCFEARKEDIVNIERTEIKIADKTKNLKVVKTDKISQNTGLIYDIEKLKRLTISPVVFVPVFLNSSFTSYRLDTYLLDNSSYEGIATKKLSNRNYVLEFTKSKSDRVYSDFQNNFYE